MKANELRIGNYVYNKTDGVIKVEEINDDGINGEFDLCWASYYFEPTYAGVEKDLIEPILLTEEWLLRFGAIDNNKDERKKYNFKEINWYFGFIGNYGDFRIYQYTDNFKYWLDQYKTIEIKYVHQLQNLYFAITGEELKIKKKNPSLTGLGS